MMKWKVCGMREAHNIEALGKLAPDFMGLIFYPPSSRYVADDSLADWLRQRNTPPLVGVFVNASLEEVEEKIERFGLAYVQLHGQESPAFCQAMKALGVGVIKVFSVGSQFDFQELQAFESHVDYFLFDTKGKLPGGNGVVFNWDILQEYQGDTPFFLSGGIGLDQLARLQAFSHPAFYGIDLNSKFELQPALKNIDQLALLKEALNLNRHEA
ncbi:MAG: phosphoribosylanthranilate isomerase [Bacteroidota bacterium]